MNPEKLLCKDKGNKIWEGSYRNPVKANVYLCVSVYRETEVKEEKKKLIVHSVPLPVLTHPPFSPSRPLSLVRSNHGSSRLLNGFQISSCWFSFWKPWLLSWDSAVEAAVLAARIDNTPYVDKQRPHMVIWWNSRKIDWKSTRAN